MDGRLSEHARALDEGAGTDSVALSYPVSGGNGKAYEKGVMIMENNMSRRGFVAGAAGLAGASTMTATAWAEDSSGISWDYDADVVIVGGGASGWAATWEAIEAGASVIVLEKNGAFGGDMAV